MNNKYSQSTGWHEDFEDEANDPCHQLEDFEDFIENYQDEERSAADVFEDDLFFGNEDFQEDFSGYDEFVGQ